MKGELPLRHGLRGHSSADISIRYYYILHGPKLNVRLQNCPDQKIWRHLMQYTVFMTAPVLTSQFAKYLTTSLSVYQNVSHYIQSMVSGSEERRGSRFRWKRGFLGQLFQVLFR